MMYKDLRDFISYLDKKNLLKKINLPISNYLEITEISDRALKKQGPALLFENVIDKNSKKFKFPVLTNLFGTVERVALAMGSEDISYLRNIGGILSELKEPKPPTSLKETLSMTPLLKSLWNMVPVINKDGLCQEIVISKDDVNLFELPVQFCWPGDVSELITWGLVVTKGISKNRQNLGIYRQQLFSRNKLIMRWLSHRGGAIDYNEFRQKHNNEPFPISVVLGCDPATILSAVTPLPDTLSEYQFAGLLRGKKTKLVKCFTNDLYVPNNAEIILEGFIYPNDKALEGPFGDHTGYYNEQEIFPVFTVEKITMRKDPIYHSTYTGRPPDEPSILGMALNEVFIPLLQKQFPEIIDFYLPPEGCSYRLAIISIKKQYKGHAKRVMMGCWSYLRQFLYTKYIIIVDDDIDVRKWEDVIWAITTRSDPVRDTFLIDNTPIDYLDFASPVSGLGGKMGIDATNKWDGESNRKWGNVIKQDINIIKEVDKIWDKLGI